MTCLVTSPGGSGALRNHLMIYPCCINELQCCAFLCITKLLIYLYVRKTDRNWVGRERKDRLTDRHAHAVGEYGDQRTTFGDSSFLFPRLRGNKFRDLHLYNCTASSVSTEPSWWPQTCVLYIKQSSLLPFNELPFPSSHSPLVPSLQHELPQLPAYL